MIKGIGVDLVELSRIKKSLERNQRFVKRILSPKELDLLDGVLSYQRKIEFLAGRFAAKEAFVKAVGTGIGREYGFQSISVLRNSKGAPYMEVEGFQDRIWVSISHSQVYAIAQVVLEE